MASDKRISELDGSFDTEESAIDCNSEDEDIDESAIDDDDDWEDFSDESGKPSDESGKPSVNKKFFKRNEYKANLASQPSMITLRITESRAKNLGSHASQSTSAFTISQFAGSMAASPNNSKNSPLIIQGAQQIALKPINKIPQSSAQPIITAPNYIYAQAALSPRTTRRNMLATELTESLRRNLHWERQQKFSTANAVLKRRHISPGTTNLKQYPERACLKQSEDADIASWNEYIDKIFENSGYHSKGW